MQEYKTLDPVLLGRPVQALEAMAKRLAQHIAAQWQHTGHRPIDLHIDDAHFMPAPHASAQAADSADVHIARATVQAWMAERYGFTAQTSDISTQDAPRSATEQRIASALQAATVQALAQTLAEPLSTSAASSQIWEWKALVRIAALPAQAMHIRLSAANSASLERHIAAQRKPSRNQQATSTPLEVELLALLVEKTVTAADIYQLQVGSVLPIAMDRARVALNGQAMLSASVAEHQGKLHLTAFETLE